MSAATGAYGGISKHFEGKKMQKRGQKLIDNFEFSDLDNVQEDRQVSTRAADLAVEQGNIMAATSTEAIRSGGARALAGGLGRVQARQNDTVNQAGANLDMQEKEIQAATARDNAAIRSMRENREVNELSGYGQMMNVGMGMKYQGVTDVYNTLAEKEDQIIEIASMILGGGKGGK
jgi:hypothetical protein